MPLYRRRVYRVKTKYQWDIVARRLKKLALIPADEWTWEMTVLLALETDVFAILHTLAIPTDLWDYYMGFVKRLWKARVAFADDTYDDEAQSIYNEYVLRGYPLLNLQAFEPTAVFYAMIKRKEEPIPPDYVGALAEGLAGINHNEGALAEGLAGILHGIGVGALGEGLAGKTNNCGALSEGLAAKMHYAGALGVT
jgi:hypothetical protein